MSVPWCLVVTSTRDKQVRVESVYGPFDEDEVGALAAASIEKGANPDHLHALPMRSVQTGSTFGVVAR